MESGEFSDHSPLTTLHWPLTMSRFGDLYAAVGVPLLIEQLGHGGLDGGIDYTRPDGQPGGHFRAILGAERTEEDPAEEGRTIRRVREAKIPRQAGLPFWLEPPSMGGTFTTDEGRGPVEYSVESIEAVSENFACVRLVRRGSAEHSRPGYRRS